jgi:terminase small subunit-like protein
MPGRPSVYSEAKANEILGRMASGEPLSHICQDKHLPLIGTVFNWERMVEGFSEKVSLARERTADCYSHQVMEIADTPQVGEIIIEKPVLDEDGNQKRDRKGRPIVMRERRMQDMTEHRKLRIGTRFKLMGMLNRKKYGADPVPVGGNTLIMPMPEAYREAINRALGFTGELKPLGMEAGQVVEAKVSEFLPE